jgi:transcriptional regulator GlxA family with amidase domain
MTAAGATAGADKALTLASRLIGAAHAKAIAQDLAGKSSRLACRGNTGLREVLRISDEFCISLLGIGSRHSHIVHGAQQRGS